MESLAHSQESIEAAYLALNTAYLDSDYSTFLSLLSSDHETVLADERRLTRHQLETAPFPFDGLRYHSSAHNLLRLRFTTTGCSVLTERSAEVTLGSGRLQEELLLQDLWRLEQGHWKLRRRIVLRQRHGSPGHFSLLEHPLFCQFGHCRTDKTTWKETRTRRTRSGTPGASWPT